MNKTLAKLQSEIKLKQNELKDLEASTFKQITDQLFLDYPEVKSFTISGGTPEFNDGDPCTYSCNIEYPEINGGDNEGEEAYEVLQNNVAEYLTLLDESFYEHHFGNGVSATVTRTGIKTEDYDIGY